MRKHLRAILLLPGMVTVAIPAAILFSTRAANVGWGWPPPWGILPPALGVLLVGLGLRLMVKTITLFAVEGQGTLAPWDPTRRLVVRGLYRHVRNPMITGVFCVLAGEAALAGSLPLLYWFLGFVAVNAVYVPLVEEASLLARFGDEYREYKHNVPRWIPRRRPWTPPGNAESKRVSESADLPDAPDEVSISG